MNKDQWTDRLSEYLDEELAQPERSALEAHLTACAECRATLEELRGVVARARTLEDQPPATDLWRGVAERIGAAKVVSLASRPRRISFNVPQLIAAGIALMLLSSGAVWIALRDHTNPVVRLQPDGGIRGGLETPAAWTGRTDAAIADLQNILARNESQLDTSTVRVIRQNLALIDSAIAQARAALAADPGDAYLNLHLADTMRRKLELLRRVNAIATAQS